MVLLQLACGSYPESYPVPPQRARLEGPEAPAAGQFVRMDDSNADAYIVKDIGRTPEGTGWRWTFQRPELRFYLNSKENLKFVMDFHISPATFAQTGPVTLSVLIGGESLISKRCNQPGAYHLEAPVHGLNIKINEPVNVVAQLDKLFVSPADGARLGYILQNAGFVSQDP